MKKVILNLQLNLYVLIFAGCNKVTRRELYSHVTTATDKSNVTRVFNDVQHSVVLHALRRNGIL